MIDIVVVDDHPLLREGIKKILKEQTNDIHVVQEASSAGELMQILSNRVPDLVVLDITMPRKSGIDSLKELRDSFPELPVLILSMHAEDRFAIRAIKAGARGYLNKSSIGEELVKAIRQIVIQKRRYINASVAEELAHQIGVSGEGLPHTRLSDREFQVFQMIVSGKKVSCIAEDLSLSVQTIHTYKTRLKKKMNMASNADLTRYAIKHNLID